MCAFLEQKCISFNPDHISEFCQKVVKILGRKKQVFQASEIEGLSLTRFLNTGAKEVEAIEPQGAKTFLIRPKLSLRVLSGNFLRPR